jgi:hypothetical protein
MPNTNSLLQRTESSEVRPLSTLAPLMPAVPPLPLEAVSFGRPPLSTGGPAVAMNSHHVPNSGGSLGAFQANAGSFGGSFIGDPPTHQDSTKLETSVGILSGASAGYGIGIPVVPLPAAMAVILVVTRREELPRRLRPGAWIRKP